MSEAAETVTGTDRNDLSKGAIVLVVGPSGAGKDTLIRLAKVHFATSERVSFPRRLITRAPDPHEDHDSIDADSLQAMIAAGEVALSWQAHGLVYAVPGAIDRTIAAGGVVIVNVSRKILAEAIAKYAHAVVVHVTAPAQVLAERLKARGRETAADVAGRLDRAESGGRPEGPHVVTIENIGDPTLVAQRLIDLVEGLKAACTH